MRMTLSWSVAAIVLVLCTPAFCAPPASASTPASTTTASSVSASAKSTAASASTRDSADRSGSEAPPASKRRARASTATSGKVMANPLKELAADQPMLLSRTGFPLAPNSIGDKGIKAFAMPLDTKLVVFPFDPNYTYPLFARNGLFTRIKLSPGEKVVGFYLSNQVRWIHHVAKNRGSVYVMPLEDGLFNTATLETNQREYELTFTSVPEPENWYQRVSWHFPASNFEEELDPPDPRAAQAEVDELNEASKAARAAQSVTPAAGRKPSPATEVGDLVDLAKVHFDYVIDGDAPFKPTLVFDDGRSTWFKMPADQDAPVFFALSQDGQGEPVTPVPRGQYVVIPQSLPFGALLKLGKYEVRIKNKNADCGFLGRNCWTGSGARNIKN